MLAAAKSSGTIARIKILAQCRARSTAYRYLLQIEHASSIGIMLTVEGEYRLAGL